MSSQEPEEAYFVVKIAYDGASEAGKTTTLRALAALLGVETQTPKETRGRTLFFDWLEYHGGRYEGRTLRCQVVSVPGQSILRKRRERLLRDADAVVFVVDSSPSGCKAAGEPLQELQARFAESSSAPGFLVQANKRDHIEAVPLDLLRARLDLPPAVPVTTSVASRSEGVRETFVFAVRLALERLSANSGLSGQPNKTLHVESPEKLLAELREIELTPAAWPNLPTAQSPPVDSTRLPDALIPIGHIWPPVDGRKLLLEAGKDDPDLLLDGDRGWLATTGTWRFQSEKAATFRDREAGLRYMLDWAFWHLRYGSLLSQGRLLALAPDGLEKAWRLWQVVRSEIPLDLELQRAASDKRPDDLDRLLQSAADWAIKLRGLEGQGRYLLANAELSRLSVDAGEARFAGLAPAIDRSAPWRASAPRTITLIRQITKFARQHRRPRPTGL